MSSILKQLTASTYEIDGITIRRLANGKHLVAAGTDYERTARTLVSATGYATKAAKSILRDATSRSSGEPGDTIPTARLDLASSPGYASTGTNTERHTAPNTPIHSGAGQLRATDNKEPSHTTGSPEKGHDCSEIEVGEPAEMFRRVNYKQQQPTNFLRKRKRCLKWDEPPSIARS